MFTHKIRKVVSVSFLRLQNLRTFHLGRITMDHAYVRYLKDAEQFQMCLRFKDQNLGINRQFMFNRQTTETVSDLLRRINTSFDKTFSKVKKKRKKKSASTSATSEEIPEVQAELTKDGVIVSGESICKEVLFNNDVTNRPTSESLCLRILGVEYSLILNAPWVDNITLPVCIMANFPVYATKLELSFVAKENCIFSWSRPRARIAADQSLEQNDKWVNVGTGYLYVPSTDDIGCFLKLSCIPVNGDQRGPMVEVISKNVVESGPGDCPFEQRHAFTPDRLQGNNFRVVSYNILADLYADTESARTLLYPYCPAYALHIDYRKQLLMKELVGYNADLMCLQEVDCKVFDLDLIPVLSSFGYLGVHHKKSGQVSEGLACMFHTAKFRLVESNKKSLAEELQTNPLFSDIWRKISNNEPLVSRFMDRNTSVQVTVLDSVLDPGARLVVGNTHLYFHPNADHIRLLQAGMAIRYVEEVASLSQCEGKRVTVLMCGDFNSTPDCGVYRLMTAQNVPDDCIDWASTEAETIKGMSLSHSTPLASACGTPDFTNFTVGFTGCLDYIFYQRDHLAVTQVVPLPSLEEVTLHTALPSVVFPSDHVSLVADLHFICNDPIG